MDIDNLWLAFGLTAFASLSTGIGSALAFFARRTNTAFLAAALGFSAGVMLYVSLVEMLAEARQILAEAWGKPTGDWAAIGAFFAACFLMAVLDRLVPSYENPHEPRRIEDMTDELRQKRLLRLGTLSAAAIAFHNLPEGLATFVGTMHNTKIGISIAVAIAIHNIPEGIAVSIPIFYATGSRRKAFVYSFLSGLTELVGALLAFVLLWFCAPARLCGLLFAAAAGIMVFISLDELLPAAREYGKAHHAIYGLLAGMAVMAASLLLL